MSKPKSMISTGHIDSNFEKNGNYVAKQTENEAAGKGLPITEKKPPKTVSSKVG